MRVMVIVKATKNSEAGVHARARSCSPTWASSTRSWSRPASCWRATACTRAQGQARALLGRQEDRHRRPVRRDQGARRRLLDLAGEVDGRGGRVGAPLPGSDARRGVRARDPPGLRGRGLRRPSSRPSCARRRSACAPRSSTARRRSREHGRRTSGRRGSSHAQGHRGGLADRVRPAASAASCAWFATSGSRRTSRRRRSSPRSSAGPRRASPTTPARGSWPRRRTAPSTQLRRRQMVERKHDALADVEPAAARAPDRRGRRSTRTSATTCCG